MTIEDQERIAASINQMIAAQDMTDRQRSIIPGTYLMKVVGPRVLARAVNALGDSITIAL